MVPVLMDMQTEDDDEQQVLSETPGPSSLSEVDYSEGVGSLNITDEAAYSLPEAQEEAILDRWDTFEDIHQYLIDSGFTAIARPDGEYPKISRYQLNEASNAELSELLSVVTGWTSYSSSELCRLKAKRMGIDKGLKDLELNLSEHVGNLNSSKNLRGIKRMTREESQRKVDMNRRLIERKLLKHKLDQVIEMVSTHCDIYERDRATLSRIVEIRRQEMESNKVTENLSARMPRQPQGTTRKYPFRKP